ncbi:helix-turn-helix transcriptional regulator [Desulforamulus aquiferis]|uniref:Helix-turn-helix transcriptional regulator n=1 Tax=Desulforamulus aquiferis TaxID=1397668 RepID=A0AAW7ZC80_9FIRM|nr:helix-turn-helix transcriptional regulator [Desulforamulus aquiferis]MDO7787006.1 helix-turn-helix transcriptional regulator [Desulforamulus aquiferis]
MEYEVKNELKKYRTKLGISQIELATEVNLKTSYYSKIETGKIIPSIKLGLMIRDAIKKLYKQKTGKELSKLSVDRLFLLEPKDEVEPGEITK